MDPLSVREREILGDVTASLRWCLWMELIHYKTLSSLGENHQFNLFGWLSHLVQLKPHTSRFALFSWIKFKEMKSFVILSVLMASAMSARLDNTYIPPASAHSAGGFNLDTPRLAQASVAQHTYAAPSGGQNQYSQQQGLNHGTFTSVHRGNGFQSVSSGSHSSTGGYQAPAPAQQAYQQSYQAPQQNYQQQSSYQQQGYNQGPSTTPIPILECKSRWNRIKCKRSCVPKVN